jgi:tRNA U34 5-carboxymethylaminomethyl modifying GTPase MnmE/TrmE
MHIADLAVRLTDTAGLRSVSDNDIEILGMERTRQTMAEADIVVWLLPADRPVSASEIEPLRDRTNLQGVRVVPLISKSDLLTKPADLADFRRRWQDLWNAEFGASGKPGEFGEPVTRAGSSAETTAAGSVDVGATIAGSVAAGTTDFAGESEILACSAKTGAGLPELREMLADLLGEMTQGGDTADLISSERHLNSLKECREVLGQLLVDGAGLPLDIITVLLNMAADALGEIIGATLSSDVLEHLFSNFCVGK